MNDQPKHDIPHGIYAARDPLKPGWRGMFQSPKGGVQTVKDELGCVRLFPSRSAATIAAAIALCRALDAPPAPQKAGRKVFKVRKGARRTHWLTAETAR